MILDSDFDFESMVKIKFKNYHLDLDSHFDFESRLKMNFLNCHLDLDFDFDFETVANFGRFTHSELQLCWSDLIKRRL